MSETMFLTLQLIAISQMVLPILYVDLIAPSDELEQYRPIQRMLYVIGASMALIVSLIYVLQW